MEDVTHRKLTNKTPDGMKACIDNAQQKLNKHRKRPDAGTGKNPKLDTLIAALDDYITKRKTQRRNAVVDTMLANP